MNVKIESLIFRAKGDQELLAQLVLQECVLIIESAMFHKLDPRSFPDLLMDEFE